MFGHIALFLPQTLIFKPTSVGGHFNPRLISLTHFVKSALPSPGVPAQEGNFVEQAKLKVCWHKARSLVLVPGGSQPQAPAASPALLAVASEWPVSLFFLAGSGMDVEGGTDISALFAHGVPACLFVLHPWLAVPSSLTLWAKDSGFLTFSPAPQGPDRESKSWVAARLDLFLEFHWLGKEPIES